MPELKVEREVGAPAERVWGLMTDMDRWTEVVTGIEQVERLDGGDGFGPGTRWRETRTMFGKQATEEMWVTDVQDGRSYTVEAESMGNRYRSVLSVEPLEGERSRVTMVFRAEPQGFVARVMTATIGKLFEGATLKALAKDLDDIARGAEEG